MVHGETFKLSRPLYVMLKPVGAHCNLACKYCYYLDKRHLYDDVPRHVLSEELLEHFIREYIGAQTTDEVLFTWHGGETFMRPLSFFRRAVELQKKYANGKLISNCIQTNGTLVTEDWARFLHDEQWLVGVSIDGPQEFHDHYRRTPAGQPSWAKVRKGIDLLNRFRVEWNAMAVVNDLNGDHPVEFYRFFRDDLQCRFLQFTPIVEVYRSKEQGNNKEQGAWSKEQDECIRQDEQSTSVSPCPIINYQLSIINYQLPPAPCSLLPFSVRPRQWGKFLCDIFDEWTSHGDVGEMFVQIFDATLANWMGLTPGVCTMASTCGHAAVMEFNGDVYSCDHFVFPQYKLGNLRETPLVQMMYGEQQTRFGRMKQEGLSGQCRQCEWLFACNGECPKNRILPDGRNYLCEGYRQFFAHVAPWMDDMKRQLQNTHF